MKYKDFIENVKTVVEKKIEGRDAEVSIRRIVKANDHTRDSLIIMEKGQVAAPTIYLNDYYSWFQNGGSIETIADEIIEMHDRCRIELPLRYIDLESFEIAREHLTCKLLNTAINEEYLADAVQIRFFDLSVVFYCTMIVDGEHVFSSKVTEELLRIWGMTVQELFEPARINTGKMLGVYLKEVGEVFREMSGLDEKDSEELLKEAIDDDDRSPMYILSNNPRTYGAVNMLNYEVLRELAEETQDDLYIIPSSVHEVLLVPVHARLSREEADAMVLDVNRNVLDPTDILSDHVYLYLREENRITV